VGAEVEDVVELVSGEEPVFARRGRELLDLEERRR
jgi:hypothetical protein